MRALATGLAALACSTAVADDPPGLAVSTPYPIARDVAAGDRYMGARLLGALKLDNVDVDGLVLSGLSALAWDEDEQRLYALSDRGVIFHLTLRFDGDLLAGARLQGAHPLLDARGGRLPRRLADAEGMHAIGAHDGRRGNTELAISFERVPRVLRFSPTGDVLGAVALPAALRDRRRYASPNRALESLTVHPRFGFLTAPEQPLVGARERHVALYALDGSAVWDYPLADEPNAGLTAIEALDDGSLLTLERAYGVFFVPFITTLRLVPPLPPQGGPLAPKNLLRLSTGDGWSLDNFEGLTRLSGQRILIVSDDNSRPYQSTLLLAIELSYTEDSDPAAQEYESRQ